MSLGAILLIVLVVLLLASLPGLGSWSAGWGYTPAGIIAALLVLLLVLVALGKL